MFITTLPEHQLSPYFVAFAEEMNVLQQDYNLHKHKASQTRMLMIGKSEEQKRQYSQRSPEAKYINTGYAQNGWSDQVVYDQSNAYKQWKQLKENVNPMFQDLADAASPTHLLALSKASDTTAVYDAAQHLKKTGKVPTVKQINGRIAGHHDTSFEHISKRKDEPEEPKKPKVSPAQLSEPKESSSSLNWISDQQETKQEPTQSRLDDDQRRASDAHTQSPNPFTDEAWSFANQLDTLRMQKETPDTDLLLAVKGLVSAGRAFVAFAESQK